jgi:hypothetical protein
MNFGTKLLSGVDSVEDLSFSLSCGDICGFTEAEMRENFNLEGFTSDEETLMKNLNSRFGAYCFGFSPSSLLSEKVLHPQEVLLRVKNMKDYSGKDFYWSNPIPWKNLLDEKLMISDSFLTDTFFISLTDVQSVDDPRNLNLQSLMCFAGYLAPTRFLIQRILLN